MKIMAVNVTPMSSINELHLHKLYTFLQFITRYRQK
jgi:hypothetical protein